VASRSRQGIVTNDTRFLRSVKQKGGSKTGAMPVMVKTADETACDAEIRETTRRTGATATPVRRRYLKQGLGQPGDKLPLFDREGAQIGRFTVDSCVAG
jgi:hypothetical protein